jgi:hypothetical protein
LPSITKAPAKGIGLGGPERETVKKDKAAVSEQDVRRTRILFGDPTMRLK